MRTRMQTLFVIYDEGMEAEITAIIGRGMVVPRYTRIDNVIGARMAEREAETGYLTDRRNRMIVAVAEDPVIEQIAKGLRALRRRKRHGLRAFVVGLKDVI
jgi:hypothetical protein